MKNRKWFILAVLLQLLILVVMIGMKWSTLAYGDKVLLITKPVDPWEMFRGDYVTLSYEISNLDLTKLNKDSSQFKRNDEVYVRLAKQDRFWAASAVTKTKPQNGTLFIKGRVIYLNEYDRTLFVDYGLDSYYVPEGQGKGIEEKARTPERVEVEVSIDKWGNSGISRLFYQGKQIRFE